MGSGYSPAQHKSQAMKYQKRVWLYGTADDVYYKGQGVCYNRDYGTAADREGERDKRVEAPSATNHLDFAGVLDQTVTIPSTGYIKATINLPGSVCDVALGSDTVVNATHLWCLAGSGSPGRFRADTGAGLGKGCVKALQTNASGNLGESVDGTAVVATKTVTKTGLFASAAVGDYVVILASSTAAGAAGATQGIYTIATVTDDDNAILATAPGDGDLACYVISGNPTALAYLYDGDEGAGGVEWIEVLASAASESMVGGVTHILGGVSLAGNCTATLADGTFTGAKKGWYLHGTIGTSDYVVTLTSGLQMDGTTALQTLVFDGASDYAFVEWHFDEWQLIQVGGPTQT